MKTFKQLAEGWEKGKFYVQHPKTKEDHKTNYEFHVRNMQGWEKDGDWGQVDAHKRKALHHGKLAGIDTGDMWMDNVSEALSHGDKSAYGAMISKTKDINAKLALMHTRAAHSYTNSRAKEKFGTERHGKFNAIINYHKALAAHHMIKAADTAQANDYKNNPDIRLLAKTRKEFEAKVQQLRLSKTQFHDLYKKQAADPKGIDFEKEKSEGDYTSLVIELDPKLMEGFVSKFKADKHPKLAAHLVAKTIWLDNYEYAGKASDGVEVTFGIVGDEDTLERYLSVHGSPDKW